MEQQRIVPSVIIKTEATENEENISLVDFAFICRICLGRDELTLFERELSLWNLFLNLTKIEVHSTVELPRKVCNECINKLEEISLFIDISKCTDLYFGKNNKFVDQTLPKLEDVQEYDNGSSRYCRACLSPSDLLPFEEKITLVKLFQDITEIDVRAKINGQNENSICFKCIDELQKASDFLDMSLINNGALQKLAKIDSKKEEPTTEGDEKSERLLGINDVKDECTDKYNAPDIKDEIFDHGSDGRSMEANENKLLHTSIDIKEDILDDDFVFHSNDSKPCTGTQIESKSSETDQKQIEIGTVSDQQKSSEDKEFYRVEERPFKCDYCGRSFAHDSTLRNHLRTHTGDKSFKCNYCGKGFDRKPGLQIHLLTHTREKPFKCDYCSKRFRYRNTLRPHLSIHTGETKFKCDHCGKSFTVKNSLHRHLLTHTGERPFKCDQCGKSFTEKRALRNHTFIHTGESPFKCDYCGKNFTEKRILQNHLFTHTTGERPFKCDQCGKSFAHSTTLRNHLVTHTGDKSFKCDKCGKRYTRKQALQIHSLSHTGEKSSECDECYTDFIDKSFF